MVANLKIEMTINELIAFAEKIEKAVRDEIKEEEEKQVSFRISGKELVAALGGKKNTNEPLI